MPCIVVRRGDYQQYDVLYKAFGARVPVIWDRRRLERSDGDSAPRAGEGHSTDRRNGRPASWDALGFVVAEH